MTLNAAGRALIREFEGCRLEAYQDSVGVWTIGVGHTAAAGPPRPVKGMTISQAEADAILDQDLTGVYIDVRDALGATKVTSNQFSALVSFTYNVGAGNLRSSTLLRLLKAGDIQGAADQFLVWNKAGGQVLAGLTRRRQAERALFLTP